MIKMIFTEEIIAACPQCNSHPTCDEHNPHGFVNPAVREIHPFTVCTTHPTADTIADRLDFWATCDPYWKEIQDDLTDEFVIQNINCFDIIQVLEDKWKDQLSEIYPGLALTNKNIVKKIKEISPRQRVAGLHKGRLMKLLLTLQE